MQEPWGAIFDWDGVVVDSSNIHKESWEKLAEELGLPLPGDHFERGFGKRNQTIIPDILGWTKNVELIEKCGLRKEEIYREIASKQGISLVNGSKRFLEFLYPTPARCAIGTSTERKNVELVIRQHNLSKFFTGATCSEDVKLGKPNPEVFLKAAEGISIDACRCVVFEDSPHGIEAAKRAGMKTVALTTTHPSTTFMHLNPDLQVASLADLSVDQVEKLFS
jgi:beta-phosphoglucomutase-like phosphatase (HAD superfamily)